MAKAKKDTLEIKVKKLNNIAKHFFANEDFEIKRKVSERVGTSTANFGLGRALNGSVMGRSVKTGGSYKCYIHKDVLPLVEKVWEICERCGIDLTNPTDDDIALIKIQFD